MPLQMRVATEADTDAIARLARAAFDPATDAIARNLFPERLQPAVPNPEDPAIAWRRTRKGIKMQTERILMMVVTDDQLDDKIVGFSMWEGPLPEGQAGESMTKEVVPCETLDEEAYGELRRASHEATIDFLGKDGSKHMWCKYRWDVCRLWPSVLTRSRSRLPGSRSQPPAQRNWKDATQLGPGKGARAK